MERVSQQLHFAVVQNSVPVLEVRHIGQRVPDGTRLNYFSISNLPRAKVGRDVSPYVVLPPGGMILTLAAAKSRFWYHVVG